MTRILTIIAILFATPIGAKDAKEDKDAMRLSFSQSDIEAAYR